jgi:hypothetical protein
LLGKKKRSCKVVTRILKWPWEIRAEPRTQVWTPLKVVWHFIWQRSQERVNSQMPLTRTGKTEPANFYSGPQDLLTSPWLPLWCPAWPSPTPCHALGFSGCFS